MKQLLSHLAVLSAGFATTATATAGDVRLYTFDLKSETPSLNAERQMSPYEGWSLLQRRVGGSEAASPPLPSQVDDETVQNLNELGGQHAVPFSEDASEDRRLLVILEGVKAEDVDSLDTASSNGVVVSRAPPDFMQESSVNDLLSQRPNDESLCSRYLPFGHAVLASLVARSLDECPSKEDALVDSLPTDIREAFVSTVLAENESIGSPKHSRIAIRFTSIDKSPFPKEYLSEFQVALRTLADEYNFESTLVLLPNHPGGKNNHKRASSNHQAQKRNNKVISQPSSPIHARTPAYLSPICHNTNDTCTEKTNSCSGHGTCYLKHSTSSKSSEQDGDCYACKCSRTVVRTNDDGTVKTAQWGGPNCSKRDVSMPFFLIGGFSILLVLAIGYGVSLLYSIGTEELPSVLSAGVAPPRGQR